jgi:hypothetical protein
MKKNSSKILVLGLILAIAISVGAVYAAGPNGGKDQGPGYMDDKGTPDDTPNQGPKENNHKLKLSPNDAARIAMRFHKDAKILSVELSNDFYIVKLVAPNGKWTLFIDGNSGKMIREERDKSGPPDNKRNDGPKAPLHNN